MICHYWWYVIHFDVSFIVMCRSFAWYVITDDVQFFCMICHSLWCVIHLYDMSLLMICNSFVRCVIHFDVSFICMICHEFWYVLYNMSIILIWHQSVTSVNHVWRESTILWWNTHGFMSYMNHATKTSCMNLCIHMRICTMCVCWQVNSHTQLSVTSLWLLFFCVMCGRNCRQKSRQECRLRRVAHAQQRWGWSYRTLRLVALAPVVGEHHSVLTISKIVSS